MPKKIKLIVGLGNPGDQYKNTRHNIGFMLIDVLAERLGATSFTSKFHGLFSEASMPDQDTKILLLKPMTFMNLSGKSVQAAMQFYKIPLEDILVIHDELDLSFGRIRIKQGGGHGGHNGLRDIDRLVGKNYWRVRFGIDHPGHKDAVSAYVLSNFPKAQQNDLPSMIDDLAYLLAKDQGRFDFVKIMNDYALSFQ